jgi:hypothetical protein
MLDLDQAADKIERTVGAALQSTPRTVRLCRLLVTITLCVTLLKSV